MTALAGANLIYGLGMLEMGVTFDYGQLVMDNEFAQMIKYCVRGIPVTDETLAVDVIREIGPFKDFVSHKQTFDFMRSVSHPKLIDRRNREKWTAKGKTDLYQRALDEARRIRSVHKVEELPAGVRQQLQDIVAETEDYFGVPQSRPEF